MIKIANPIYGHSDYMLPHALTNLAVALIPAQNRMKIKAETHLQRQMVAAALSMMKEYL